MEALDPEQKETETGVDSTEVESPRDLDQKIVELATMFLSRRTDGLGSQTRSVPAGPAPVERKDQVASNQSQMFSGFFWTGFTHQSRFRCLTLRFSSGVLFTRTGRPIFR